MTWFVRSAAVSVAALCVLASQSAAQSAKGQRETASGKMLATTPDSAARAAAKARPAAAPSYAQLSAALGALPARTEQFVRMPSLRAERITLVDVRNLFRENSQQKEFETSIAD